MSEALKTICCLLDVAPWQLGVLSTSKGLIAGPLEIHLPDNSIIDCSIDRNGNLPIKTNGINDFFMLFIACYSKSVVKILPFFRYYFVLISIRRNNASAFDVWYNRFKNHCNAHFDCGKRHRVQKLAGKQPIGAMEQ